MLKNINCSRKTDINIQLRNISLTVKHNTHVFDLNHFSVLIYFNFTSALCLLSEDMLKSRYVYI